MEKRLRTVVQDELAAALKSTWPQFEPVSGAIQGEADSLGWRVFRWHADEQVWFFLTLVIGNRNKFAFRCLWSDKPDYPADDTTYPFFQNDPAQMPGSRDVFTTSRGGTRQIKEWEVGVNPAFVPAVVVPAAVAELKKTLEPVTIEVLNHHGNSVETPLGDG
jgi:hypothetical protein